jgi:hypothetical protein
MKKLSGMGIREYARHLGVCHRTVQDAIAHGRIKLMPNGRIAPLAADIEWFSNTNINKSRMSKHTMAVLQISVRKASSMSVRELHRHMVEPRPTDLPNYNNIQKDYDDDCDE